MNYRHAYHAGNHADVLKHIILVRILEHLKKKEKPFRFLDLHAGIGVYALESDEASKTLEWQGGVGRLYDPSGMPKNLSVEVEELIAPWREAIAAVNPAGNLNFYPGSPEIARLLLRRGDRINLNELHPDDFIKLEEMFGRDRRVALTRLDASIAIKAQLPPPERRGLILIDPPYEVVDEAERTVRALAHGLKRFATGIFCLWYPITGDRLNERIVNSIEELSDLKMLRFELLVRAPVYGGGLAGSGMVVVNPPWQLDHDMAVIMPALESVLAETS